MMIIEYYIPHNSSIILFIYAINTRLTNKYLDNI